MMMGEREVEIYIYIYIYILNPYCSQLRRHLSLAFELVVLVPQGIHSAVPSLSNTTTHSTDN